VTGGLGLLAALGAGVVSFLSPCVLPLVPGYVSFLTGAAGHEDGVRTRVRDVLVPSLLFVVGFSAVFVLLGVSASLLGAVLRPYRGGLTVAAGVLIAAFGVLLLGVVRVPWLYREARLDPGRTRRLGRWAAPVMGVVFALGWTPCVGPVLGSILMLAGSEAQAGRGAILLLAYSAGLAVPFIATALLLDRLRATLTRIGRYTAALDRMAGAVLVVVGVLIATGTMATVTSWLARLLPMGSTG
jgi:cytochrome c-type biogenesis protein